MNRAVKTALCTVVYPSAWKWVNQFVECINKSEGNYTLVIINDGVDNELVHKAFSNCRYIIEDAKPSNTISECRIQLLNVLVENNFQLAIFNDFDDMFSPNRIVMYQENYIPGKNFYYNNLMLADDSLLFSELPNSIESVDGVLQSNFLGLGNTGVNIGEISADFIKSLENVSTNVFDWYFYTRLLLNGFKGNIIENTVNYYRLGEFNLAGVAEANQASMNKELQVKICHYRLLKKYDPVFNDLYNRYLKLEETGDLLIYQSDSNNGFWWNLLKV